MSDYCWDCIYIRLPVNLEPCLSCDELLKNRFKKNENEEAKMQEIKM